MTVEVVIDTSPDEASKLKTAEFRRVRDANSRTDRKVKARAESKNSKAKSTTKTRPKKTSSEPKS
jgi:hypothetical protein